MINDLVIEDGALDNKVLEELYNEALELSGLVVEYFQVNKKETLAHLNIDLLGSYTLECNRITTGIMQAISWCLMQKGVKSGEITVDFASEKKNRLTDNELFSEDLNCDPEPLPKEFINYSERTRALYIRIVRIDRLLYENNGSIENPVHNMMNKIEKI